MKKIILVSTLILSLLSFNLAFAQDAPPSIPDFDFPESGEESSNEEAPPELEVDEDDDDSSDSGSANEDSSSGGNGNRSSVVDEINNDLASEAQANSSSSSDNSNSTVHAAADDVDSDTTELPETGPELYMLLLVALAYWTLPMISRKIFIRN